MEEAVRASLVDALPYYDSKEGYHRLLLFFCFGFFLFFLLNSTFSGCKMLLLVSWPWSCKCLVVLPRSSSLIFLLFPISSSRFVSLPPFSRRVSFFSFSFSFRALLFSPPSSTAFEPALLPVKFSSRRVKVAAPDKADDVEGWETALAGAMAEHGYLRGRLLQLELQKKYGKDAWVAHNELVAHNAAFVERELEETRIEVNEVNLARKREHTAAGKKLDRLETRYHSLRSDAEAVAREVERIKRQKSN